MVISILQFYYTICFINHKNIRQLRYISIDNFILRLYNYLNRIDILLLYLLRRKFHEEKVKKNNISMPCSHNDSGRADDCTDFGQCGRN